MCTLLLPFFFSFLFLKKKLEEFKIALDAAGAIAVLMMNLLTATLDDQMQYLQRAKNVGVLVEGTYVELGGEFYWGKYR